MITPPKDNDTAAIRSPCVRNCCLDDQDICLGCGRALTEITGWSGFSDAARQQVLVQASQRLRQRGRKSF